jgi:hypothetical protein
MRGEVKKHAAMTSRHCLFLCDLKRLSVCSSRGLDRLPERSVAGCVQPQSLAQGMHRILRELVVLHA